MSEEDKQQACLKEVSEILKKYDCQILVQNVPVIVPNQKKEESPVVAG